MFDISADVNSCVLVVFGNIRFMSFMSFERNSNGFRMDFRNVKVENTLLFYQIKTYRPKKNLFS